MAKRIVIYTTPWRGDCKAATPFLGERGIAYEEIDAARFEEDLRAAGAL